MAQRKRHNEQNFYLFSNGKQTDVTIYASTLYYPYGWVERVEALDVPITMSKQTYYNRDWQRFHYESCLKDLLHKLTKYFAKTATEPFRLEIRDATGHYIVK